MARVEHCDIIVIGGGSAAFEAAVAAREAGAARVVMLEKAPEAEYGGNARYSGTGFRFVHGGAGRNPPVRSGCGRRAVRDHGDSALQRGRLHGRSRPHDAGAHEPRAGADAGRGIERGRALDAQYRHQMGAAEGARQGRRQALFRARHRDPCRRRRHRPARRNGGGSPKELGIEIRFESPVCGLLGDLRRVEGVRRQRRRRPLRSHGQGGDRLRRRLSGQSGNARALSRRQHRHR